MKNRVRKAVEMIQQCGADMESNLSAMDLKLYLLSPSSFSSVEDTEFDHNESNNIDAAENDRNWNEDMKSESVVGNSYAEREDEYDPGYDFGAVRREFVNGICFEEVESMYVAEKSYEEGQDDCVAEHVENENDSSLVMEFRSPEELNDFVNSPVIVNDEEELHISNSLQSCGTNAEREDYLVEREMQEDFSDTFELNPTQSTSASNTDFPAMKNLQRGVETTSAPESCSKSIKAKRVVKVKKLFYYRNKN